MATSIPIVPIAAADLSFLMERMEQIEKNQQAILLQTRYGDLPPTLNVNQVAKILQVSKTTVYKWAEEGESQVLKPIKLENKLVRFRRADVIVLLEK